MTVIAIPAGMHHYVNGQASGWSVYPVKSGRWQWSAYGPHGGSMGSAATEPEARAAAQREADWLGKGIARDDAVARP
jgi:hypothetical protein